MLTLSIPSQNHFGSPTMSPAGSPTTFSRPALSQPILRPPTLMNPRRSMMPQGDSKRPKLSLQTAILPQPISPALPLPSSADTPTSRNTLANSFRSPAPDLKPTPQPAVADIAPPYDVESVRVGILKNSPLEKLLRSRRQEKKTNRLRVKVAFVDEPEIVPRPPQDLDAEFEDVAADGDNLGEGLAGLEETSVASPRTPMQTTPGNRPRSDSAQWRRLRTQRSANEGRELRRGGSSTPLSNKAANKNSGHQSNRVIDAPSSPAPSDDSEDSYRPPQTPETPSPAQTRDWVWTLGDDFNRSCPYTPPESTDNSRRSSTTADENIESHLSQPLTSSKPPVIGGRMPDTPKSATSAMPITPARIALPTTPLSASEKSELPALRLQTLDHPQRVSGSGATTPRSVPLPETPLP